MNPPEKTPGGRTAARGSHNVGRTHYVKLVHRLYPSVDSMLDQAHAKHMLRKCLEPKPHPKAVRYMRNDRGTSMLLDNNYHHNILEGRGLLFDHHLFHDRQTWPLVKVMARDQEYFFLEFAQALTILSENNPLIDGRGEVQRQCNAVKKHYR